MFLQSMPATSKIDVCITTRRDFCGTAVMETLVSPPQTSADKKSKPDQMLSFLPEHFWTFHSLKISDT